MDEPTINDMMIAYADDAVEFAKSKFNIELDYSSESIKCVEDIAARLYASIPRSLFGKIFKAGPSDKEIDIVCKMLGGYIGEVYRKIRPGEWGVHEQFGAIGIKHEDSWFFPPAKVHKRLSNGEEDNLSYFFSVALDQLGKHAAGT